VIKRASPLISVLLWFTAAPAFALEREVHEIHYQMGTLLEFRVWHSDPEVAQRVIRESVREVHRLEEILSSYDPESAVSRFNENAGEGRMAIAPELFEILQISRRWSQITKGYFDVTVGPLLKLWRRSAEQGHLPGARELTQTAARVGYSKLSLYADGTAALMRHGMAIDLGGIGKGYAVDRIAARFKAAGMNSALISFGTSSICAIGAPPGAKGWAIGIEGPDGKVRRTIHLSDSALSTSGGMGRFWTIRNKGYGHVINPKTGLPVTEARVATVISESATAAEALSKPLVLVGTQAFAFVEHFPQTRAVLVDSTGALSWSRESRPHRPAEGAPAL
jgi:thiamine biosynthesis lipoprotein